MIEVVFINESQIPWPQKYVKELLAFIVKEFRSRKVRKYSLLKSKLSLSLVFLSVNKAKKLNKKYRHKDYATDVLSFLGEGEEDFGELVICPEVIKKQAKDHKLTFKQELAYVILHGFLHLLGYDHEKSAREDKIMMKIQDEIFQKLL
jgi:probable rRNA maturation factor